MKVRNSFKGLDLIECLKNYGWRFVTLNWRQVSGPSPRERNAKSQNGCLRKPYKQLLKEKKQKQRRKGKIYPPESRVPKRSMERKQSLLQRSMQRNRGKQ